MAQIPQILGQNLPVALVDTTLAAIPNGTSATVSVYVANQSPSIDAISIALVPDNQVTPPLDQPYNWIAYQTPILGNGVFAVSSIYLNSGDRIQIISANGTCSFTATGIVQT